MKPPSPVAREYAQQHVGKLFAGRKGHGKSIATSRLLGRRELEAQIARGFDMGIKMDEAIAEVH